MKPADIDVGVMAEELRQVLNYDPLSGLFTWRVSRTPSVKVGALAGSIRKNGYVALLIKLCDQKPRCFKAHRLAFLWMTGRWPSAAVDHIDGCRSNNRWEDLREADAAHNAQNQRSAHANSGTGLLGVTWHKRLRRYQSKLSIGGKDIHLGTFVDPHAAHAAYVEAKRKLHAGCTL